MKLRLLSLLVICLFSVNSYTQIEISGKVIDIETEEVIPNANIIMLDITQKQIYKYTTTNDTGEFTLRIDKSQTDSIYLKATSVNIDPKITQLEAKSQYIVIRTKKKIFNIKEVVVKSDRPFVRKTGDTLIYAVSKYATANDKFIEDVIKRMPGIEVKKNGKILYQGKSISKFYIEDMDMLGGRYAIASKNINPSDVASVMIYENHQAIKALKDLNLPDEAALNIKLKSSTKGVFIGGINAGIGYEPWSWNSETMLMYFGKQQFISTYKTNNTGNNIVDELSSLFNESVDNYSIIGIQHPYTPPINEDLYLRNNTHAITTNNLFKLSNATAIKTNVSYVHDDEKVDGVSITTHYIPAENPISINEVTHVVNQTDIVNVDMSIESNREESYLKNSLLFKSDFNKDNGQVLSNNDKILQRYDMPVLSFKNNLHIIFPFKGKSSIGIKSIIEYKSAPASLIVSPMPFPEIFDSSKEYSDALQKLSSNKFIAKNTVYGGLSYASLNIFLNAGLNAHIENMNSELSPMNAKQGILVPADSMRNDIKWKRFDVNFGPRVTYLPNRGFNMEFFIYADLMRLVATHKIHNDHNVLNKIIANPFFKLSGEITSDLKYTFTVSYNEYYGNLYDSYQGFIMTNYRNFTSKTGEIDFSKTQNYKCSLSYTNVFKLFFANVYGEYWQSKRNITYAIKYNDALTYLESLSVPNKSYGYELGLSLNKQLTALGTILKLSGKWIHSFEEIIRQSEYLDATYDIINLKLSLNTRFAKQFSMEYNIDFKRNINTITGENNKYIINFMTQELGLFFSISNKVTLTLSGSHFYNEDVSFDNKNLFFVNGQLTYRHKKLSYTVEGRNLINTQRFSSSIMQGITQYTYSYSLRPRLALL